MAEPSGAGPPPGVAMTPGGAEPFSPWSLGVCWAIRAIAVIVVALRLWARKIQRNTAGWDDWTMLVAVILAIGDGIANTFQIADNLSMEAIAKTTTASQLLNFSSLFFMRLSICIFVLRLLPPTQKWPKWATYVAIFLNVAGTIINYAVFGGGHQNFGPGAPGVEQHEAQTLDPAFLAATILGVIVDFITVGTPIFIVKDLQMNTKTKAGIIVIMALSIVTAGCSIGKLVVVASGQISNDPLVAVRNIELFSNFEESGGIIFGSLPALRQLYMGLRKKPSKNSGSSPYYARTPVIGNPMPITESQKDLVGKIGKQTSIDVELSEIMADEEKAVRHGPRSPTHGRGWEHQYTSSQSASAQARGY